MTPLVTQMSNRAILNKSKLLFSYLRVLFKLGFQSSQNVVFSFFCFPDRSEISWICETFHPASNCWISKGHKQTPWSSSWSSRGGRHLLYVRTPGYSTTGADHFGLAAQDNTLGRCILYTDKIASSMSGYCEKAFTNKSSSKKPLVYPLFDYLSFFSVKEHLIVELLCLPECQTTGLNYLMLATGSSGWFILCLFCFGKYVKKQSDYNSASCQWSLADP